MARILVQNLVVYRYTRTYSSVMFLHTITYHGINTVHFIYVLVNADFASVPILSHFQVLC